MSKVMLSRLRVPGFLAALAFLLTAAALPTKARAAEDIVHFGNSIEINSNQHVHDAVCFFCDVKVHGTAGHDIVVFFGNVSVNGQAEHDVVDFFGDVRLSEGASISHDMVNFFGSTWLGENASVGQDAVVMFGSLHEAGTASIGKNQVVEPGILFWGPFLIILGVVVLIVRESRRARYLRLMRGY